MLSFLIAGGLLVLLSEVDVGENVVLAEAAVADAFAAIAELQVGIVRVRAAADGAFVVIALLLLLLPHGLLKFTVWGACRYFRRWINASIAGQMNTRKFSSATTGRMAPSQLPASRDCTMPMTNTAISSHASHLIFTGMK